MDHLPKCHLTACFISKNLQLTIPHAVGPRENSPQDATLKDGRYAMRDSGRMVYSAIKGLSPISSSTCPQPGLPAG